MKSILRALQPLAGWVFAHMSFAIPVKRLRETETLMAFHHPAPSYPFHVLIVPKKAIAGMLDLESTDQHMLGELFAMAQSLVKEYDLKAYRLLVNGGDFQDFPQLHFHLIAPDPSKE